MLQIATERHAWMSRDIKICNVYCINALYIYIVYSIYLYNVGIWRLQLWGMAENHVFNIFFSSTRVDLRYVLMNSPSVFFILCIIIHVAEVYYTMIHVIYLSIYIYIYIYIYSYFMNKFWSLFVIVKGFEEPHRSSRYPTPKDW